MNVTPLPLPAAPLAPITSRTSLLLRLVAIGILLLSSGAVMYFFVNPTQDLASASSPIQASLWFLFYAAVIWRLTRKQIGDFLSTTSGKLIVAFLFLALASTLWSIEPVNAFKRSMQLLLSTGAAYYLSQAIKLDEWRRLFIIFTALIVGITLISVVGFSDYAIHHDMHSGAWRGLFIHKNDLGRKMAIFGIMMFLLARPSNQGKREKLPLWLGIICVMLVIMSHSSSALLALVATAGIVKMVDVMGKLRVATVPIIIAIVGVLVLLSALGVDSWLFESVLSSVGKDATLTDRVPLWHETLYIMQRDAPILGYGYESFWDSYKGALGLKWPFGNWMPPHAHNGLVQIGVNLGMIGMVLAGVIAFAMLALSIRLTSATQLGAYRLLPLATMVFAIINNITEIGFLIYNNFLWLLPLITIFAVRRASLTAQP